MSCCGSDPVAGESGGQVAGEQIANSSGDGRASLKTWLPLLALALSAFVAGNSVLAAVVVNIGEFEPEIRFRFHLGLLLATGFVVVCLSPMVITNIRRHWRQRLVSIDLLFLLAILGAAGMSLLSMWQGSGPVYFEVISILLCIYCVGGWVKRESQARVRRQLDDWSPRLNDCRVIGDEGQIQEVRIADVRPGQCVAVAAGSLLPVDGQVVQGEAFVRESSLTGEPHSRHVSPSAKVRAGSALLDGPLVIQATARGDAREIDSVANWLEAAYRRPSRWQSQASRLAAYFTPFVACIAVLSFAWWWWFDGLHTAWYVALATLLVACPCGFGFATPVAIWVMHNRLVERGLWLQRGDALERLATVDRVVFDKTGTLTVPEPHLHQVCVRPESDWDEATLLQVAESLQVQARHPLAEPFMREGAVHRQLFPVQEWKLVPGVGVEGELQIAGQSRQVELGRLEALHRPCCDASFLQDLRQRLNAEDFAIAIRVDGELVAVAAIREAPKETLAEGLRDLQATGRRVAVLTGDRGSRVEALQLDSTISTWTGLGPLEKAEQVAAWEAAGERVLLIGDGINDVAAMAQASVSLAVSDGAELTREAADGTWKGRDVRQIAAALHIVDRGIQRLRNTLRFALLYNAVGISLAVSGWLHPVAAVILMMGSSLTVVLRAGDPLADRRWQDSEGLEPATRQSSQGDPLADASSAAPSLS